MLHFLIYRIRRQVFSQSVHFLVRMVIIVQLIFQKLTSAVVDFGLEFFVWWGFKVVVQFWWCELLSLGDKLSFEVGKESESFFEFLQRGIFMVGSLEKSFFVVLFYQWNHSVGPLDVLVNVFMLIFCYYLIALYLQILNGRNVKLSDFSQESELLIFLHLRFIQKYLH